MAVCCSAAQLKLTPIRQCNRSVLSLNFGHELVGVRKNLLPMDLVLQHGFATRKTASGR